MLLHFSLFSFSFFFSFSFLFFVSFFFFFFLLFSFDEIRDLLPLSFSKKRDSTSVDGHGQRAGDRRPPNDDQNPMIEWLENREKESKF